MALVGSTAAPAAADSIRDRQWYLPALKIGAVHKISQGSGVTVAVIDTGVDAGHRDLAGAVLPGIDLLPRPLGDGRDDLDGHGTSMAGLIAARGHGSGDGILGIAPAAKILPIRTPIGGPTSSNYLTKAVAFAKAKGAGVINMSFTSSDDDVLREAVRAALAADIVVVAGAGNRGNGNDNYPGSYPEVLTVGATARSGKISQASVTGPQIDLTAPGEDIASIDITESGYHLASGTSDSTAIVSGAVALVRAKFPDLSAAEVVHRLTATAEDAGAGGRDDTYGHGRLDILKALTAEVPAAPGPVPSGGPEAQPTSPVAEAKPVPKRVNALYIGGAAILVVLLLGGAVIAFLLRRRH